ncbi:hypothetical protein E1211_01470 [Micromonospora sp. 15K316]|uniref:hypothetical protein n=1 Tax=Micromonospora sp. 15K316 TaxID=2530376 RepID=UPI001045AF85|nr:hypothetical protein [Micromonospora sp. 15K316]TDC40447.1 hypothetical protein E1211_01470 [Micromonospora sp. 15K316]
MGIIARHVAGAVVAWLVFTLEGLVGYLGLLGYALITNADPGGPLAGPIFVLVAAMLGLVAVPVLVVPAALIAETTARRRGRFVGALIGGGGAMLLAALCAAVTALVTDVSAGGAVLAGLVAALAAVGPLAAHAATAAAVRGMAQRLRRPRPAPTDDDRFARLPS